MGVTPTFPVASDGPDPAFETQHEVAALLRQGKRSGHIKRCAHLFLANSGDAWPRAYWPECRRDSFRRERKPGYGGYVLYGCRPDCELYSPAWRARAGEWLRSRWRAFRDGVVGTAKWYASLNGLVQLLISVAILAAISPPFIRAVADLVRAVQGK